MLSALTVLNIGIDVYIVSITNLNYCWYHNQFCRGLGPEQAKVIADRSESDVKPDGNGNGSWDYISVSSFSGWG